MRVLHLPTRVGGNAWFLSRAEREIGLESDVLYTERSPFFDQPADVKPDFLGKKNIRKLIGIFRFYKTAIKQYDVFHFNFGSSLCMFPHWCSFLDCIDLLYLMRHNKVIAVTYQGSDARMPQYCLDNYPINYFSQFPKEELERRLKQSKIFQRRIDRFEKYADLMYATNADLINTLPKRTTFRPYTKMDVLNQKIFLNDYSGTGLVVVHAPTNRDIKGSKYVIEAIHRLQEEGYPIELKLIEKMTNEEALKIYQSADLVVDQLFAGWYGGFAVECMAMGKPVIAYIRECDLCNIPEQMKQDLPIINATSETIYDVLKDLYMNKKSLKPIAENSRKYVEKWHNCRTIAEEIAQDYQRVYNLKNDINS